MTNSIKVVADPSAGAIKTGGAISDFHGYVSHHFVVDGRNAILVEPKRALLGQPWIWRMMFWDAFSNADVALLGRGYYIGFIDVGDTFGCPDAMNQFDAFYDQITSHHGLSKRPTLEGMSRGGLYAYRWASFNPNKVGCIYVDAPVCDMKSWPGAPGRATRDEREWQQALRSYHFTTDQQLIDFKGNPIDILAPIGIAHISIIDVCGDSDQTVPATENSFIVDALYIKQGGPIAMIIKEGCDHHPHGLSDPAPIVDFIVAQTAGGDAAKEAEKSAPKPGSVLTLPEGKW